MTNSAGPRPFIGKMPGLPPTPASGNSPHTFSNWGLASGSSQVPTVLLATFPCTPTPCTGTTNVGPITAGSTVSADDTNSIWVFFGTGRFFTQADKGDRKSTRLNSSHLVISYAVFCLKKKKKTH